MAVQRPRAPAKERGSKHLKNLLLALVATSSYTEPYRRLAIGQGCVKHQIRVFSEDALPFPTSRKRRTGRLSGPGAASRLPVYVFTQPELGAALRDSAKWPTREVPRCYTP